MRSKKEKITASIVGGIVTVCTFTFLVTFVKADLYDPDEAAVVVMSDPALVSGSSAAPSAPAVPKPSASTVLGVEGMYPSRLIVPALNINANVQYVTVNAKGNIGTPDNFTDVAWYSLGVVPGQAGTAIIDGHVDNGLGLAGVFKHLSDIQLGDEVDVVTKAGGEARFIVTNIQVYDYQNVPSAAIFGAASASSTLKLITCDGTWVPGGDTYNERLVVTASLVS